MRGFRNRREEKIKESGSMTQDKEILVSKPRAILEINPSEEEEIITYYRIKSWIILNLELTSGVSYDPK
jgi:hypothetical protein